MNIALLVTGLEMGGAESQVVSLADRYAVLGHRVLLISLTGEGVIRPSSPAIRLSSLGMSKAAGNFVRSYRKARRMVRDFRPHVVHSHMVHANIFARLLRMTTDMPRLVCTAHSTNEGGSVRMWAYRLTDWLADMTTNVSDVAVATYIRRRAAAPHKISPVQNGIDCHRFHFDAGARARLRNELAIPDRLQLMLAVGRIADPKDYGNLLHAFANLSEQCGECVLCIAGTGPDLERYKAMAESLAIADRVRFLGLRRDIPELMCAADVFVLSSSWEGWPLVIGEALACERVVVSTDAGGVGRWLGGIGAVVPVSDSRALAEALLLAVRMSPDEKRRRGRAGREKILTDHSLDAVALRWLEIYRGNFPAGKGETPLTAP